MTMAGNFWKSWATQQLPVLSPNDHERTYRSAPDMGAFDDWAEHVGFQARPPRTLNEAHISIKFLLERTEEIAEKLLRDSVSLMDQVKDKLPW
ncbi:hypothetical protein SERLA73DRAFT_188638, partial [Serpula lacrymans var. lacrymans S7.3]